MTSPRLVFTLFVLVCIVTDACGTGFESRSKRMDMKARRNDLKQRLTLLLRALLDDKTASVSQLDKLTREQDLVEGGIGPGHHRTGSTSTSTSSTISSTTSTTSSTITTTTTSPETEPPEITTSTTVPSTTIAASHNDTDTGTCASTSFSTLFEGLGEPELYLEPNVTVEQLTEVLTPLDMLKLVGAIKHVTNHIKNVTDIVADIMEAASEEGIHTAEDLKELLKDVQIILGVLDDKVDSAFKRLGTAAVRGLVAGTEEDHATDRCEPGCHASDDSRHMNTKCVVNKMYLLMDAVDKAEWRLMSDLYDDGCYDDDCFMVYDYLDAVNWANIEVESAVKALVKNSLCLKSNVAVITDNYMPDTDKRPSPPYLLPRLIRYLAHLRILHAHRELAVMALKHLDLVLDGVMGIEDSKRRMRSDKEKSAYARDVSLRSMVGLRSSKLFKPLRRA